MLKKSAEYVILDALIKKAFCDSETDQLLAVPLISSSEDDGHRRTLPGACFKCDKVVIGWKTTLYLNRCQDSVL